MSVSEINSLMGLLSVTAFVGYWVLWSHRDGVPMAGSVAKAAAVATLAAVAAGAGLWPIALGLGLGAVGDFALSRRGQGAFLAGMAAFALGHLCYAAAFWGAAGVLTPWHWAVLAALLALLISTEFWLAPRTGALRLPVRGYVSAIGAMAAVAVALPPGMGRGVIWGGVALFVASDLLLALRLFVVTDPPRQRALSLVLWPAYWLGQVLILLGALSYWAA